MDEMTVRLRSRIDRLDKELAVVSEVGWSAQERNSVLRQRARAIRDLQSHQLCRMLEVLDRV